MAENPKKTDQKTPNKSPTQGKAIADTVTALLSEWGDSVAADPAAFAKEVRERVQKIVSDLNESGLHAAASLSLDDAPSHEENRHPNSAPAEEDFWDLGTPKPRSYAPPHFSSDSLGVTDVHDDSASSNAPTLSEAESSRMAHGEPIPPRDRYRGQQTPGSGRVIHTVNGPRCVSEKPRVVTRSYRRPLPTASIVPHAEYKAPETVKAYGPTGSLIRSVTVRTWENGTEFYGRFASDARQSHGARPSVPADQPLSPVPYFSYVPQYAHMNRAQVEYYRWLRENIRLGRYPQTELSYLQLYIFEIINLPELIQPEEGAHLLASLWIHYRKDHPRLDSFLCEWMADYCLIGGCPMPPILAPILPEIVPKAQFKEFYLNSGTENAQDPDALGKTLLEVCSDYDYRGSRYYQEHKEAYETHLPAALTLTMQEAERDKRGVFALDRVYKMTRDSYCGAIIASGIKRRLDLEFLSYTRRADARLAVTAMVKYAENKLRAVLGIKAKLTPGELDPADTAVLDRYFAPLLPVKQATSAEDKYMPADYMKNYESEEAGFDFSRALAIEADSWANTGRLTGESLAEATPEATEEAATSISEENGQPAAPIIHEEQPSAPIIFEEKSPTSEPGTTKSPVPEKHATPEENTLRDGLQAALLGEFRSYCRKNSLYEGDLSDRINSVFLEELGDVVLESTDKGFTLIEDYREDVENWLLSITP